LAVQQHCASATGSDATAFSNAGQTGRLAQQVEQARVDGDTAIVRVLASSAVGLIRDVVSAGEIVRGMCAEAEEIIRARSAALMV
jgi:hypothetical protein